MWRVIPSHPSLFLDCVLMFFYAGFRPWFSPLTGPTCIGGHRQAGPSKAPPPPPRFAALFREGAKDQTEQPKLHKHNMKTTDPENPNPIRALSHPEQMSTDTNPRRPYEVTVHRTDYRYTKIRVEAECEEEAENMAERLAGLQEDSAWEVADRDLYAFAVEQVQEGGSHE